MPEEPTTAETLPHVGTCAILGLPNVGKSTLLNQLLGLRMMAVSPRPQTTRNRVVGVVNGELEDGPSQIVFVDTPGIQRGRSGLRRYMRDEALAAAGECDVALLLIDGSDPRQRSPEALADSDAQALAEAAAALRAPLILGINKVDKLGDKTQLLPVLEAFGEGDRYAALVPLSAKTGNGVDRLATEIAQRLPPGPRLFPEEMYTDRAERFLAGELVREQLFRQLGQEVPYATAVEIESFSERPDRGDVVIAAVIHVERDSQKGIVVGKGGQRIKSVGERARAAISELFGCPVHLKLHVVVTPEWSSRDRSLRELGYE